MIKSQSSSSRTGVPTDDLVAEIEEHARVSQERGRAVVEQLLDGVELVPRTDPNAITRAVEGELAAILGELRAALEAGGAVQYLDVVGSLRPSISGPWVERLARGRASAAAEGDDASTRAFESALEAFRRLEGRLRWLLQPTLPRDLWALQPRRDAAQIRHAVGYEFRLEGKLVRCLSELRSTLLVPGADREMVRALIAPGALFDTALEWGDSLPGRRAMERIQAILDDARIAEDGRRLLLTNELFVLEEWNATVGWRPLNEVERLGRFYAHAELAAGLGIPWTDDYYDTHRWWRRASEAAAHDAPPLPPLAALVRPVVDTSPVHLRASIVLALSAGMDPLLRELLGVPRPTAEQLRDVRQVLRWLGQTGTLVPRSPFVRSIGGATAW